MRGFFVVRLRKGCGWMEFSVVILAAGTGSRCDLGYNKMLYPIEGNQTIIEKTVAVFENIKECKQIVLVINKKDEEIMKNLFHERVEYAYGGPTRQESSLSGLSKVGCEIVMIHDGARPYVSERSIYDCLLTLQSYSACLLMIPVKDTIKRVNDKGKIETLNREEIFQAQTPQGFKTELIQYALKRSIDLGISISDDASAIELCTDRAIAIVLGDDSNYKITSKADLK